MSEPKEIIDLKKAIDQAISAKQELEFLDFKVQWPEFKSDLIHDILALCNCDHQGNRYLVFGVDR